MRMHFTELLELLRSQEGAEIKDMTLGDPASNFEFDEVAADLKLLMPSSRYEFSSSGRSEGSSSKY
jgi:hypothetical protein